MTRVRALVMGRSAAVVVAVVGQRLAPAGPPLICWEIEIGDAKSLPWEHGTFGRKEDYDVARLVSDTLAILTPDTPVLVRMETLRRATIYATPNGDGGPKGRAAAWELVARLFARALDGETRGTPDGLAWFDAGYLVGACGQGGVETGFDGYAYALRGRSLVPASPELEFALALMRAMGDPKVMYPAHQAHLAAALAGARDGSLLAKNLLTHLGQGAKTLDEMRAAQGKKKAGE